MSLLPRNDPSAQQSNPLHTQMKCTNEAGRAGGRGLGFPLSRSPPFPRLCHVRHADKVGALTWDHDVLVVRAVRSLLGMSLGSSRWALHKSLRPTGEGFATLTLTIQCQTAHRANATSHSVTYRCQQSQACRRLHTALFLLLPLQWPLGPSCPPQGLCSCRPISLPLSLLLILHFITGSSFFKACFP